MQATTWQPIRECFPANCRATVAQLGPPLYLTVVGPRFEGRIGQIGVCAGGGFATDEETYTFTVLAERRGRATRLEGYYRHQRVSDTCPAEVNSAVVLVAH